MQKANLLTTAMAIVAIAICSHANAQNNTQSRQIDSNSQLCYTSTYKAYSADHRQNTEVRPLEGALAKVMKLNGVKFQLKNTSFSNVNLGFIPQNVKEVLPEAVRSGNVEHASIVPVLVEAIKEQQKQIETQQMVIDRLQRQVNALLNATATPK